MSLIHDPSPLRRHNDARWKALKGLACLSPVPTGNPSILRRPLAKEQINSVCALERERPNPIIPFPGDTDQIVNSTPLSFTCVRNSFQKGHIDVLTPNRGECKVYQKKVKNNTKCGFSFSPCLTVRRGPGGLPRVRRLAARDRCIFSPEHVQV